MASPIDGNTMTAFTSSLNRWVSENIFHTLGMLQIGTAVLTYLLAWLLARELAKFLTAKNRAPTTHLRLRMSSEHFALMARYVLWVLSLLFCQALFHKLKLPGDAIRLTVNLALILLVVRFASFYIKSRFWATAVYIVSLVVISLRIFNLWQPIVDVLNGITINLGAISFSVWGLVKSFTIFAVLWALASAANRFFARWLSGVRQLTYSDRVLFQRLFNAAMVAVVILVSLHAAGIHMAAIAVTGGAIGIAIGVGLQRIGSNLVSGILLLMNKPIRQGDVVAIDDAFSGTGYGWITRMDLMYVHVATRDGTEHLVPNETFVTRRIENLSYSDSMVRLRVPFGIAYKSDLKKAAKLALDAASATDRVLKAPAPACVVKSFGESSVMLEVRVWIDDPRKGIGRVKSNVYQAIWDIFHANGIEIPFPQRDLHFIRSGRKGENEPKAKPSATENDASGERPS
jgi:small-conductance mechanosensitive channel